jgi:hypothetical protein
MRLLSNHPSSSRPCEKPLRRVRIAFQARQRQSELNSAPSVMAARIAMLQRFLEGQALA